MPFQIKVVLVTLSLLIQFNLGIGQDNKDCFEQLALDYMWEILAQEEPEYEKLIYFVDPTISINGAIEFNKCFSRPKLSDKDIATISNLKSISHSCQLSSDMNSKSFRYRSKIPWFRSVFKKNRTRFIEVYEYSFLDSNSCIVVIGVFGSRFDTFYTLKMEISSGHLIDYCFRKLFS